MNKVAARLSLLTDLYDNGLLCKCEHWVKEYEPDNDGLDRTIVVDRLLHDFDCTGKDKALELLGFIKENK